MNLSFGQQLALTIIDKAIIGVLLLIAGYLLNAALERRKAGDELKKAIALERVNAYRELWKISIRPFDATTRPAMATAFRDWYSAGGALFLSFNAASSYFQVQKMLTDAKVGEEATRAELSRLRTELKHDCGTYERREADTQIVAAK